MVVLDATVVNIALPSAQDALHFSDGSRQWIVTAYALAFGSLIADGQSVRLSVCRRCPLRHPIFCRIQQEHLKWRTSQYRIGRV
jgi:MFS family permease